jgi:ABC-2 type transport system ATP-binding protein
MIPIEVTNLTKRFGHDLAVDAVTFSVRPGEVTGFLGRNGAGKSTTLRMILGLERPTAGTAAIDGQHYAKLHAPLRHVGSLLDARAVQPGSNATDHLLALARSNGIERARVSEVLDTVGLGKVGRKKAGTFSLGMLQRLGLAAALLGDPPILVLDEPLNGLDPEGIIWFRDLMRSLAAEGRTVLLSSHLMTEMVVTADHLLIIGEGRLLLDSEMAAFQREHEHEEIHVRTADPQALRGRIIGAGGTIRDLDAASIAVTGLHAPAIGALALKAGVELYELAPVRRSLQDAFMELTTPSVPESAQPTLLAHTAVKPARSSHPHTAAARQPEPRFRDVVRSELTKFRSTRTRPIIVVSSILASAGSAILFANATAHAYKDFDEADRASFDPTNTSLRGRSIMSITVGMLGALAFTSEYSSDTIDPSLAAVPDRTRLFAAKVLTTAGISLATGLVANTASFLVGQAMFAHRGTPHDTFRSKGSVPAVLGGSLHRTLSALLGLATGTLTRSTAATVSTIVGAELLVPGIAPAFPKPLPDILTKYWLTEAGASIFATRPNPRVLRPWIGLGVMAASTVAVLGVALATFHRRDV